MIFINLSLRNFLGRVNTKIFFAVLVFLLSGFSFWLASLGNAVVRTEACGTVGTLSNGGFETPLNNVNNTQVAGSTTGTSWQSFNNNNLIEIWRGLRSEGSPLVDYRSAVGVQHAELNANAFGGLYQDISTTPGQTIHWKLQHRGRGQTDTMQVLIGTTSGTTTYTTGGTTHPPLPGTLTIQNARKTGTNTDTQDIADGQSAWGTWQGSYVVPSSQTTTRFFFVSKIPSTGSLGNFLDDIVFTPFLACPSTRSITFGSTNTFDVTSAGITYGTNPSLTQVSNVTNPNGVAGTATRSDNNISFTPMTAGNGQTLDYTIQSTHAGSTFTDEARITYNVSATVPATPTALTGTPNGSTFPLSWTAPTNNGGVAISDYVVEYSADGTNWITWNDGVNTNTSTTITGLNASTTYRFRVTAKNDGSGYSGPGTTGSSAPSAVLTVSFCSNLNSMSGITGQILWLRADCVNGTPTQPSDGASVTRWEDLSPENHDATQVSGQTAPTFQNDSGNLINSQPVLNFTRTSDSAGSVFQVDGVDIRAITNPDVSIFVVYKPRRASGDAAEVNGVWGADNEGWDRFFLSKFQNFGNDGLISLGPGSSTTTTARVTDSAVDGTTRLLTAVYDGTVSGNSNSGPTNGSKIYFGSTLITSFTDTTHPSDALSRLYIGWDGDGSAFRGDIAEFIVFDRALESDLPTINQYLNDRYNLGLDVSTNLPTVIHSDPKSTEINIPSLALTNSTNAMICFEQVSNSAGDAISGSANIAVRRTTSVTNVTETIATNSWRYSGTRANVQTQIDSIQITGTGGNPVVNAASKWVRVRVTRDTSNCGTTPVQRVIEIRPLGLDGFRRVTVRID